MSRAARALRAVAAHFAAIRYRLLIVNLVVVAVPVVGIAFARLHERQLLAALERDLIHQAAAVRAGLAHGGAPSSELLADTARATSARLQIVDGDGRVVADSLRSGLAARVAERPDVAAALAGHYGAATRVTAGGRRVELDVALPWRDRDGRVIGAVRATRTTAVVMKQLVGLRVRLFDLLLIAAAVTAALSLFLAWTIARPLATLTRAAERVAAGQRGTGLGLARRDEIGQLSRAVDRMAAELDRRAREQRELAADISHELKTPLTAIRGATELLRDGAVGEPAARDRFLAMILDDAARLDRLVTRLLELSRLESDDAAPEPLDLVELARSCAGERARVVGEAAAPIVARADALAAALDNLITNAVQHAAPSTPITVAIAVAGGRARVEVHNLGPPISPAVQAKVWDRFFTTRGDRGGSGLGLAIVRAVAERHGGRAGVTSSAAAGTRFWIELPTAG